MTRDERKYASQTTIRLIVGALLILFVVGLGLIGWLYGPMQAVMGFLCLLGAMIPVGLVALSVNGLDWILKRIDKD